MRKLFASALAVAVLVLLTGTAIARSSLEVESEADLEGSQEVPAVTTDMSGEVEVEVKDDELEFALEVEDNSHDIFAAHIHCAAPGVNGPVGITLFSGSFTAAEGTVAEGTLLAPDTGNACGWSDLADVAAAIAAGNAYVNVHTTAASGGVPSGEIRGNLGVDLEVEAEADLAGAQEVPAVTTDMSGEVELEIEGGELEFDLEVEDNSHDIFAAHVHCAAPGVNGPVGITLFSGSFTAAEGTVAEGTLLAPDTGNACGWSDLADVAAAVAAGNAYVNVHTTAASGGVPSGEIRGNLAESAQVKTRDVEGTVVFTLNPTCDPASTCAFDPTTNILTITLMNPATLTGTFEGTQVLTADFLLNVVTNEFTYSGTAVFDGTVSACGVGTVVFDVVGEGSLDADGNATFVVNDQTINPVGTTLPIEGVLSAPGFAPTDPETGIGSVDYEGEYICDHSG